jgi:hypothetical protein
MLDGISWDRRLDDLATSNRINQGLQPNYLAIL